ncbi:MAG: Xaa-Pro aminopeptidase [Thermoleophilaceae bacterium]|nr:Xaa-Pro aminopeptidase [Thermoleophilaceae bacterium]
MSGRVEQVAAAVAGRKLDALLITSPANLRWATGFTGSNGAAVIGPDVRLFFTDFRYVEQAAEQVPDFERVRAGRDLLGDVAGRLNGRVGFEDQWLSVRAHDRIGQAVNGSAELVGASGIVERLREVKEAHELDAMRAAARIADRAYEDLAERGIAGRTEKQIAADLEVRMRELGADDRSFPAIVASGAQGALPHAVPRDTAVERDTLMVVDMGCVVDGYCSDCTRTFATGSLSEEAQEIYDLVARSQLSALDAVRAGADCRAVDGISREIIAAAGHGEHYGHGLGHGVGLEVHEGPRLAQTAEGTLVPGNTVTVEPGVYLPGKLGVRIEDLVAVTDDGCETISGFTKSLVTLA